MRPNDELLQRIAQTRRKWKLFVGIRGAAWTLGAAVLAALAVLGAAESSMGFKTLLVVTVLGIAGIAFAAIRMLALPVWRPPTDEQMARFIQERNPGLDDCLVSAVETIQRPNPNHGAFNILLVKDTLERTRNVRFGEEINKRKSHAMTATTLALAAAFALLVSPWLTPFFFPHANEILMASFGNRPPKPVEIVVTPGDVTVPRGSDVRIEAIISGFVTSRATAYMHYESSKDWESSTMEVVPKNPSAFRHVLFNLQETVRYYVDASDRRSSEFTIRVADLPRIEQVDYTYNYPPYTGLAPRKEENAINIAALRGTLIDVFVAANQPLSGGRMVFDDGKAIPLAVLGDKKTAGGRLTVDHNTKFRIELTNTSGAAFLSLDERFIEVLDDGKPLLTFNKPGRDYPASKFAEVFSELKAEDDYGIGSVTLYYSVNGGAEKRVELFKNPSAAESPKELTAPYTFFLEDFNVNPGDFVSYYGKAEDSHSPPNKVTTDVYFIEIKPWDKKITQSSAGGGGGGGGGNEPESIQILLKGEKDLIAATHKLINLKADYSVGEWTSLIHSVGSRQQKLSDQTTNLLGRLDKRNLDDEDTTVKEIAENLKRARDAMAEAVKRLAKEMAEPALESEQQALTQLGRASALFTNFQISRGGGGGGGRSSAAMDLEELADLELDQTKNQFETQPRGQAEDKAKKLEEAVDELKGLAERQQKQAEQRKKPGGSASTQELREEIERLARQLQKLSRDSSDPRLAEVAKQLERASESLRQQQQATNERAAEQAGQQAAEAIRNAQNMLGQQGQQRSGAADRLAEADRQGQRLAGIQREIAEKTEEMARDPEKAGDRKQEINQRKDTLAGELGSLRRQLENIAGNADRETANQARNAANTIRDRKIPEGIESGRKDLNSGAYSSAVQQERRNEQALNDLQQQISQAARAASGTPGATASANATAEQKRLEDAIGKASQLADQMQSLNHRAQAQANQGNRGEGSQPRPEGRGDSQQPRGGSSGQGKQPSPSPQPGSGNQPGKSPSESGEQGTGTASRGAPQGSPSNGDAIRPGGGFDPRQLSSEIGNYQREVRELRNSLGAGNPFGGELNKIDDTLRSMGTGGAPGDAKQMELLSRQLIEPFRNMEFELSRQLELLQNKEQLRSAREEDIPANLKGVIGNYFEKLGKSK